MAEKVFVQQQREWLMSDVQRYGDCSSIDLPHRYEMIWLASWYPSQTMPTNGDFIQRHAEAVSASIPLLLIHTIHNPGQEAPEIYEMTHRGSLTEIIIYFKHSGSTDGLPDKIRYNFLYYRLTKKLLSFIFKKYGLPKALHVHVPMKMGKVAMWAKAKWDIPYLVSEQSSKYVGDAPDHFDKRNFLYRKAVKDVFRNAAAISNVSAKVAREIENRFGVRDVRVIRNLADTNRFRYTGRKAGSTVRFLHVSTLTEQKNFYGILKAFEKLFQMRKDVELVVLGGEPGDQEHWPIRNAPWLHWKGTVPHHEVADYMQEADVFVLFSRDENFPCVIVEALCSGLPVITSDAGGCAEAIDPENGKVIRSGDDQGLLTALVDMITSLDMYNHQQISSRAAATYSYPVVAKEFIDLYRSLGLHPEISF